MKQEKLLKIIGKSSFVIKANKKGNVNYVSDSLLKLLNIERIDNIFETSIFNKKDWNLVKKDLFEYNSWEGKLRSQDCQGKFFWFDIVSHVDEKEAIFVLKDITEQVRLEELNKDLQSVNKIGGWDLDIKTGESVWTSETYKIHEIAEGTYTDKIQGISHYADHEKERITKCVEDCIKGIPFDEVFEFYTAKGNYRWVRSIGKPIKDSEGKVIKLVGTFQDVTEKMMTEKILASINVGIWKWDLEENKVYWDDNNYKVFDLRREDFYGAYEAWESTLEEDDKLRATRKLQKSIEDSSWYEDTFKIKTKSGYRYIGAKAQIIRNKEGKAVELNGINWDRTSEHESYLDAEEQRAMMQHNAKMISIGNLSAGIGHEINNPLTISLSLLRLLKKKTTNQKQLKMIKTAITAQERIANIVKGVKSLSYKDEKINEKFNAKKLIDDTFDLLFYMMQAEGIKLIKKDVLSCNVVGSIGQINQVLINLITNAKDASLDKKEIIISMEENEENLLIKVTDFGEGIDEDVKDKIFNPFFTTKEVGKGTGLGLSLSHKYIKAMGGDLFFESKPGKTTFIISLKKHLQN